MMRKIALFLFSCILFSAVSLHVHAQSAAVKPYLGATIAILDSLPKTLQQKYKLISKNGIVVQKVFDNSPAKTAGLEVNDVIQKLNDSTIVHPRQFIDLLWTYKVGDQINLTINRNGKKLVKPFKLTPRPDTELK